jgi:GDP-L-fucose synthase
VSTDLLVTGGGGLLGSALRELCPSATSVTSQDCDLTDLTQVRALFDRFKPRRVLHLAACVGGVQSNAAKNADLFTVNTQMNVNVLSVANQYEVQRLVSVLSSCAFALYPDRPSAEDDLHVGMPFEGNLGYGCSKRMLDVHTRLLWKQHGCRFSTIAPVTMYGPRDNFDLEDGHVIGALIHKMVMAKETGATVEVWGGGQAVRQFVYAKDVARVLLAELDSFEGPETLIVAPDQGVTIRALVGQIAQAIQFIGSIIFDRSKPEGVLVKRVKSIRFESRYPGFSFTPMEVGLAETVAWFRQHGPMAFHQAARTYNMQPNRSR